MTHTADDLHTAARELNELLPRLAALIPHKTTVTESRIGSHGKAQHAPAPWNEQAAMLYYEIHGDARRYESLLTLRLFGRAKYRGGDDKQTAEVITRLPDLIAHGEAQGLHELDLEDPTRDLLTWPTTVRRALDESREHETPWMKAPGGLCCPECDRPLYLAPGWQYQEQTNIRAMCRRCRNEDGTHLTWEPSAWLGKLQETADGDPEELITIEKAKREHPHVRPNTFDVWAWRALNVPASAKLTIAGRNSKGRPLFRRADITNEVNALANKTTCV